MYRKRRLESNKVRIHIRSMYIQWRTKGQFLCPGNIGNKTELKLPQTLIRQILDQRLVTEVFACGANKLAFISIMEI